MIDAYVLPGAQSRGTSSHDGFNVEHFGRDGMRYFARLLAAR